MELTVGKADLQKELQLCQGVVEKRSTIPILSNVLLKAADGKLQVAATDLDVTILTSCSAKITTPECLKRIRRVEELRDQGGRDG